MVNNYLIDELSLVYDNVTEKHIEYITRLSIHNSIRKSHSLKLCRQPSRIYSDKYIGKYSFYISIDNIKVPERIMVFDNGLNLYETDRGKRRLINYISKTLNISKNSILI